MNIDWPRVRATGEVIAGLTAIHGLRYRKWEYVHTFGVVMGFAATAAILLYGDVSTLRGKPTGQLTNAALCTTITAERARLKPTRRRLLARLPELPEMAT
jgi:hypothetical protein